MFTIDQIKEAHSKVKSGADFPSYIKEIKSLGVTLYQTFVSDGHVDYYGLDAFFIQTPPKFDPIDISKEANSEVFKEELRAHQQGKTDFPTFIKMCASNGIEKWAVDMSKMTCTYYDRSGGEVLVEVIPN
jgi:uncharacterized protein YbcV (DUF1398 family)